MMSVSFKTISIGLVMLALVTLAWTDVLDKNAKICVDAGFNRAIGTYATARLIGAAISVAENIDLNVQIGAGVKVSPGQILHPVGDLVDKFSDAMLAASIIFGSMKILIAIGNSYVLSVCVTCCAIAWLWCYRLNTTQPWLSKLIVIIFLIRFSVPITMIGSNFIYESFMSNKYSSSESQLIIATNDVKNLSSDINQPNAPSASLWSKFKYIVTAGADIAAKVKLVAVKAETFTNQMIDLIIVFLLQTLVIPLVFFWTLVRVFTAMFQTSFAK
jgi:hypothetical protein